MLTDPEMRIPLVQILHEKPARAPTRRCASAWKELGEMCRCLGGKNLVGIGCLDGAWRFDSIVPS